MSEQQPETNPVDSPAQETVTINVHSPFTFTHDNGIKQQFAAGSHQVEPYIAEHWFVKGHLVPPSPGPVEAPAEAKPAPATGKGKPGK